MGCIDLELYLGVGLVGREMVNHASSHGRSFAWYLVSLIYALIFAPTVLILSLVVLLSFVSS